MQPWQLFHATHKHLDPENVTRILTGKTIRLHSVSMPEPHGPHPLHEKADAAGIGYVARSGIGYLETASENDVDLEE
jgi:hypothetical protein